MSPGIDSHSKQRRMQGYYGEGRKYLEYVLGPYTNVNDHKSTSLKQVQI